MHRINYFFIAALSLFAGLFIGMFITTWHYLDHPVIKEVEKQPVNVENNYYLKREENYIIMPTPYTTPFFENQNQARPRTSLRYIFRKG